jgi:hypothetical protein
MSSIFLSHTHSDKTFARKMAADLRHRGHIVWFDEAEIEVGDSLIEKIRDGIDRVDFVMAIISKNSVMSMWVQQELDLASNREIEERRVIVLPVLLEDVELPGFLKGKLYADFRTEDQYDESFALLLRRLGPGKPPPPLEEPETKRLYEELHVLRKSVAYHSRESQRRNRLAKLNRSPALEAAIQRENIQHPEWALINDGYAFEALGAPITLDYVLHAANKARTTGAHVLEATLTIEDKWDNLRLMIEAYSDYLGLSTKEDQEAVSNE